MVGVARTAAVVAACTTCVSAFLPAPPVGRLPMQALERQARRAAAVQPDHDRAALRAAKSRRGPRGKARLEATRMAVDAETERKWKAFGEWATEQGIQSPKLALAEFDSGLRGVKAEASISSGDNVLSVPVGSVLRVIGGNTRLPAKMQGYVSEQTWRDAEWWGQLALMLLWEKGSGRAASTEPSKLTRWIDMLPATMSTPLHWTEAEIDELQYAPLISKCIRQRTAWKVLLKQVQKDNPGIGEAEFFNACEMARSRAFSGPYVNRLPKDQFFLTGLLIAVSTQLNILDTAKAAIGAALVLLWAVGNALLVPRIFDLTHYVIAPMIDMVNHNGAPGAAAGVTYQAIEAKFEVQACKPYASGDQVPTLDPHTPTPSAASIPTPTPNPRPPTTPKRITGVHFVR
jgi:hypothetical protein